MTLKVAFSHFPALTLEAAWPLFSAQPPWTVVGCIFPPPPRSARAHQTSPLFVGGPPDGGRFIQRYMSQLLPTSLLFYSCMMESRSSSLLVPSRFLMVVCFSLPHTRRATVPPKFTPFLVTLLPSSGNLWPSPSFSPLYPLTVLKSVFKIIHSFAPFSPQEEESPHFTDLAYLSSVYNATSSTFQSRQGYVYLPPPFGVLLS